MDTLDGRASMVLETEVATFRWSGGAYIEVGCLSGLDPEDGTLDWRAHDVINVWDYERDEPIIARSLEAFEARCAEWLVEQERQDCAEAGEPCEDDIMVSATGPLGARYVVAAGGRFVGEADDWDGVEAIVREWREAEQLWPNVWRVDDHGGATLEVIA